MVVVVVVAVAVAVVVVVVVVVAVVVAAAVRIVSLPKVTSYETIYLPSLSDYQSRKYHQNQHQHFNL